MKGRPKELPKGDPKIRFMSFVKISGKHWLWTGHIYTQTGYGQFWLDKTNMPAHRAAWILFRGPIPDDHTIDHLCRIHACVNPECLEPTTQQVNTLRGIGPSAVNHKKTHCDHGHEFNKKNTWINPKTGARTCRVCGRDRMRERRARARAATASSLA